MRDLVNNIGVVAAMVPAVRSAAADSAAIDLQGFEGATMIVNTGAIVSAGDFGVKIQESDTTTGGDFTDVAAGDLDGTIPATLEASTVYRQAYLGGKRYIRVSLTKAGGTSIAAGAVIVQSHPRNAPVA